MCLAPVLRQCDKITTRIYLAIHLSLIGLFIFQKNFCQRRSVDQLQSRDVNEQCLWAEMPLGTLNLCEQ